MTTQDSVVSTSTSVAEPAPNYKYYVLGLLFLVGTVNFIDRQILSILQEPIKNELGLSDSEIGLLPLAFVLLYVTSGLPIARLADRYVRQTVLAVCITVWSVMTALCGLAQGYMHLMIARAGVGAGEAGAMPITHSLIADYFPPDRRATAIAIYATAVPMGAMLALIAGGTIADAFGWRMAFLVVGLPGVLLALIIRFTLKEPPRGHSEGLADPGTPPKLGDVARYLWARRSFRHMAFAGALQGAIAYGTAQWYPSFFQRIYEMSLSETAITLGLLTGIAGVVGVFGSGVLADRLGKEDQRWYLWICILAQLIGTPLTILALWLSSPLWAMVALFLPMVFGNAFIAITGAVTQNLAPLRMRAASAAVKTIVLTLVGLGMGPLLIGVLSDWFEPTYGVMSLRYALSVALLINFWSAAHYYFAVKHLRGDLAYAQDVNHGGAVGSG